MIASYLIGIVFIFATLSWVWAHGPEAQPSDLRFPKLTLIIVLIVAIFSILGILYPIFLAALARNLNLFEHGQYWRLVTPLFVQDGGVHGTIFNLCVLAIIGSVAEQIFSKRNWLVLFFGTGILAELVAYFLLPQGFAGNSIANMGLAAGVAIYGLYYSRRYKLARFAVSIAIAAGATLLLLKDLHGAAFIIGVIITAIVLRINLNVVTLDHNI